MELGAIARGDQHPPRARGVSYPIEVCGLDMREKGDRMMCEGHMIAFRHDMPANSACRTEASATNMYVYPAAVLLLLVWGIALTGCGPNDVGTNDGNSPSKVQSSAAREANNTTTRSAAREMELRAPTVQMVMEAVRLDGIEQLTVEECPSLSSPELGVALAKASSLHTLLLSYGTISTDVVRAICNSKSIRVLSLRAMNLTDADLGEVGRLASLEQLVLASNDKLTSEGLRAISTLSHLRVLNIGECTGVDDRCIDLLGHMPALQWLIVYGSGISPDGIEALRKALPKCTVLG